MKRIAAALVSLFAGTVQAAEWNASPEALVRAFQADYLRWNNDAVVFDAKHGTLTALDMAEVEYAKLLKKYCRPDFKGEPIAFGDESSHDPAKEHTLSVQVSEPNAVVRTELHRKSGYRPVFEYELLKVDGRWYLLQIYLLDKGQRIPGL